MNRASKTLQALLLGSLVLFPACGGEASSTDAAGTAPENAATSPAADLEVTDAAVHVLPGGVGAAYLRVRAGAAADRLLSVTTPLAGVAELHESFDDGGMMRMEPRPDGFEVAAGGELLLAQGGKHVMFHALAVPDDATETELTLRFAQAGERKVRARVVRPGGER